VSYKWNVLKDLREDLPTEIPNWENYWKELEKEYPNTKKASDKFIIRDREETTNEEFV